MDGYLAGCGTHSAAITVSVGTACTQHFSPNGPSAKARRWDKDGSFWRTRGGQGMEWGAGRIVVADRLGPIRKRDPLHCDLFVADRD